MPGTTSVSPASPLVINQTACASWIVAFATASVARGVAARFGLAGPAGGSVVTGRTSGAWRAQVAGGDPPSIHVRTAFAAQPDGSAVTVLWPTPGTTVRWP